MRAIGRVSYSWYLWHWPVLVLTPALLGHPLGLAGRLAAALVSGVLAVLTLRFIENPLRFAAPIRRSPWPVSRSAVRPPRSRSVWAWRCPNGFPSRVPRGPAATPLTITAAPAPTGDNIDAYDAAVQHVFAASADRGRGIRGAQSRTIEPGPAAPKPAARQRGSRPKGLFAQRLHALALSRWTA